MRGYTPRPWVQAFHHSPVRMPSVDIFSPAGNLIANVVREADARLIAAAPDLLEACKASLRQLGLTKGHARLLDLPVETAPQVARLLEAAIAKAEEKTP